LNVFFVYALLRNDEPCYIGKGKGVRHLQHAQKGPSHPNKALASLLNEAGGQLPAVIISNGLTESEAFDLERVMIALVGREPFGPLVNKTAGGQGSAGFKHSVETKALMAERRIGKSRPELWGLSPWNKNVPWSDRQRESTASWWTEERRLAASNYWKARGHCPPLEASIKGGRATKGLKTGPNKSRGVPKTAAHRAAISAARKNKPHPRRGVPCSPETRAKISATKRLGRIAALAA